MDSTPTPLQKTKKPLIIKILQWPHVVLGSILILFLIFIFSVGSIGWNEFLFLLGLLAQATCNFVIFYSLLKYKRTLLKLGFIANLIAFAIITGTLVIFLAQAYHPPPKTEYVHGCFDCGPSSPFYSDPTPEIASILGTIALFDLFSLLVIGARLKNKS